MGSEIIIPGTPTDLIPAQDRPVFDPALQNGFPGLAQAPAASQSLPLGVTKEVFAFQTQRIVSPGIVSNPPAAAQVTVNAGSFVDLNSVTGFFGQQGTLILQALGAVTTGAVFVGDSASNGVNLTKAPGGQLIIPHYYQVGALAPDTRLINTDAANQVVNVMFWCENPELQLGFSQDFALSMVVNRTDVMRLRELLLIISPNSSPGGFHYPSRQLVRLLTSDALVNSRAPMISQRSLEGHEVIDFNFMAQTIGDAIRVYHLPQAWVVNGSDSDIFALAGAFDNTPVPTINSWSPTLVVEVRLSSFAQAGQVDVRCRGVIEIFRNLNQ